MADQDWTPVVLTKNKKANPASLKDAHAISQAKMSGQLETAKKFGAAENKSAHGSNGAGLKKLEEANDVFSHQTVDKKLSQSISQARLAKKMTQAQLATAINERPQIIQEYESGKAIPNPQILNKLDKALGVHLPRK